MVKHVSVCVCVCHVCERIIQCSTTKKGLREAKQAFVFEREHHNNMS